MTTMKSENLKKKNHGYMITQRANGDRMISSTNYVIRLIGNTSNPLAKVYPWVFGCSKTLENMVKDGVVPESAYVDTSKVKLEWRAKKDQDKNKRTCIDFLHNAMAIRWFIEDYCGISTWGERITECITLALQGRESELMDKLTDIWHKLPDSKYCIMEIPEEKSEFLGFIENISSRKPA